MTGSSRNILTVIAAPHWGGLHVVVERTTPFYAEAGYRRFVALPSPDQRTRSRLEKSGCIVIPLTLHRIRKTTNPLTHLRFARHFAAEVAAIRKIVADHAIDIMEVAGLLNLQPAIAARVSGMPLIWQLHSTLPPLQLRKLIGGIAMRTADVVMTSGRGMISRHGGLGSGKAAVIPFCAPVDLTAFVPDLEIRQRTRRQLGYRDNEIVVGTLGNRGWSKQHEIIIDIADRLRDRQLRFAIVGMAVDTNDEYYREKVLKPLEMLGLQATAKIVEQRHSAAELMNAFDIFVLPSRGEGASLVTSEAMATALPIVASDVGSLSDIVATGVNGYLCPVDAPGAFCEALKALEDGDRRREMGTASRARALAELGERRCAEAHFEAYWRALEPQ